MSSARTPYQRHQLKLIIDTPTVAAGSRHNKGRSFKIAAFISSSSSQAHSAQRWNRNLPDQLCGKCDVFYEAIRSGFADNNDFRGRSLVSACFYASTLFACKSISSAFQCPQDHQLVQRRRRVVLRQSGKSAAAAEELEHAIRVNAYYLPAALEQPGLSRIGRCPTILSDESQKQTTSSILFHIKRNFLHPIAVLTRNNSPGLAVCVPAFASFVPFKAYYHPPTTGRES
jgi:hypothetical protein